MDMKFIILPLTGAFIGWITNWIAIKFLFYPRKKIFGVQGVVPKRKKDIAIKVSEAYLKVLPDRIEQLTGIPIIGKKILNYFKKEVAKKVHDLDDAELQEIIEKTANKEFKFIIYSGAVLGFIIGLIQALIVY